MKFIYFIENFTENYFFHVTTALEFEANISICAVYYYMLGDSFKKLLQVPAKN